MSVVRSTAQPYAWAAPAILYAFIACVIEAFILNSLITDGRLDGPASNIVGVAGLMVLGLLTAMPRGMAAMSERVMVTKVTFACLSLLLLAVWIARVGA